MRVRAFLVITMLLVGVTGCSSRGEPVAAPDVRPVYVDFGMSVWLGMENAETLMAEEPAATATMRELASAGVREVCLEVRDASGRVAFPTELATGNPDLLRAVAELAARNGMRTSAVFPLFLGEPTEAEAVLEASWDAETGSTVLLPRLAREGRVPRLNPMARSVRERQKALLADLGATGVPVVHLSHAGFPGPFGDFSPDARRDFESRLGRAVPNWPGDVMAFEESDGGPRHVEGALWREWSTWRVWVMREIVFDMEEGLFAGALRAGHPVPGLGVFATGYAPLMMREGLVWGSPYANWGIALPEFPRTVTEAGLGELFDVVTLELMTPLATDLDAEAAGAAWWASVEGACDMGLHLLGGETARRVALAPAAWNLEDERGRRAFVRAMRVARDRGWSVVLVAEDIARPPVDWETIGRVWRD